MHRAADAYHYAQFLVVIHPDIAIDIIKEQATKDPDRIVRLVNDGCDRLGRSFHDVMSLLQHRRIDELKGSGNPMTGAPLNLPPLTSPSQLPFGSVAGPPPPSPAPTQSTTHSQPVLSHENIAVLYELSFYQLSMRPSGTQYSVIESTTLSRFPKIKVENVSPIRMTQRGQFLQVTQLVRLTWRRGSSFKTHYTEFYIVPPNSIQAVDVLLGESDLLYGQQQVYGPGQPGLQSPDFVPLDQQVSGFAPDPFLQSSIHASSATRPTYSTRSSPTVQPSLNGPFSGRRRQFANDIIPAFSPNGGQQQPPRSAETVSGFPPPHAPSTDAQSARGSPGLHSCPSPGNPSNIVKVKYASGLNTSKRTMRLKLDLTAPGQTFLNSLESATNYITEGLSLNLDAHAIEFRPLTGDDKVETTLLVLGPDCFEDMWEDTLDFINENRSAKRPEFLLLLKDWPG